MVDFDMDAAARKADWGHFVKGATYATGAVIIGLVLLALITL